jgi:hypothetical protein
MYIQLKERMNLCRCPKIVLDNREGTITIKTPGVFQLYILYMIIQYLSFQIDYFCQEVKILQVKINMRSLFTFVKETFQSLITVLWIFKIF